MAASELRHNDDVIDHGHQPWPSFRPYVILVVEWIDGKITSEFWAVIILWNNKGNGGYLVADGCSIDYYIVFKKIYSFLLK